MKNVLIVGAGFSGMSLAFYLNQKGCQVTIVEKNSHPGGMIFSPQQPFGMYESAANGFLNTAKVESFLSSIEVKALGSATQSSKRYIFRSKPRRWPLSFSESIFFSIKLLLFFTTKKVNRMADLAESVQSWSLRKFGRAFTNLVLAPALQGIYAGDINKLSANLVINQILNRKRQKKLSTSTLISAQDGMGQIMRQLEKKLIENGVQIKYSTSWNAEMKSDHLVIATSANQAFPVLNSLHESSNASLLANIEMLPLITATCFFNSKPARYKGFGILFPRNQGVRALGLLMNSVIFDRKSKKHSETYILGGALDANVMNLSDEELTKQIQSDRDLALGQHQNISEIVITRWLQALPHYTIALEKILSLLKPMPAITLHGNYLGSLGLSRLLERSESLAEEIVKAKSNE